MALLQLRGVVKGFGARTILDGLDFDVEPGSRVGVIGPNGGGKSTLMRILAGWWTDGKHDHALDWHRSTATELLTATELSARVKEATARWSTTS